MTIGQNIALFVCAVVLGAISVADAYVGISPVPIAFHQADEACRK